LPHRNKGTREGTAQRALPRKETEMISPKMQEALNRHVQHEAYSSWLYLAMASWCEAKAWKGFARWLRVQSQEELDHAKKSLDFLLARGGAAALGPIEAPPSSWASVNDVFEKVLDHERGVTRLVSDVHGVAVQENDKAAAVFLQWFISEQVEEEARATEIVDRLRMVGDRPGSALYLDKEYGKRGRTG
jgi:ferritin